jgi:hypothetical protein
MFGLQTHLHSTCRDSEVSELSDELQALKSEVSRLFNTRSDGMFDAARNRADALAYQIKTVVRARCHHSKAAARSGRMRASPAA